jgi:GNAT superfamily N-acetyltransferase
MNCQLLLRILQVEQLLTLYPFNRELTSSIGRSNPRQIGLARLITDEVSFAYLTDVYILDQYQGKGLGTWLIECVNETISSWPELRRLLLVTSHGQNFYTERLSMKAFDQGKNGLVILSRKGEGSVLKD